ncbi:uncharacterized protein AB675_9833 [Cyphellophora attinorum]|uniref:Uncharacterized protein n=1 Tax=Cyphellophora attinorum TaxID=1664694 RepID=A0A0N1HCG3_9EURO|nr:uncharacterized protein AB675_9833 [Phialophora attinorum]KPI42376.1 hypothetical protein AB675_9833 [Phialophora attinorum]
MPAISLQESDLEVLIKRQCTLSSTGIWECDNHYVKLSTLITKIQDTPHGDGASADAHAYFYTNLREPTPDESSEGKEPSTAIWQRWMFLWFIRQGIALDKFYGAFNAIDAEWYKKQLDNTDTHGPLDTNDLDQTKSWPFPQLPPAAQILEMCFMQALAAAATNPDVYFFTKKGEKWKQECPEDLEADPAPMYAEDGTVSCADQEPELLWDRSRDKEVQPGWICPVKETARSANM